MPSRLRRAVVLAALFATVAVAEAGAEATFASCRPKLEHRVECARVPVELDRSGVVSGSLSLHVERIRARAKPARGALLVLSGGPGESVSAATDEYAYALAPALAMRDLVLVDQRGTGLSGALRCPSLEKTTSNADADRAIAACGAALGARLPYYSLVDVVDDLEDVRRALGVERISLAGVSYGTRVALAYAARYPQHVELLVLDSVVPLADPGAFRLNSFAAVPRVLSDVCTPRCAFTSDANADLAELVRRLALAPLEGRVAGGDGRLRPARLNRLDLFNILVTGDFLPQLRTPFPAAVRSALDGDAAPLLRLRDLARLTGNVAPRAFSTALFLATTCAETWSSQLSPVDRTAAARMYLDGLSPDRFGPFDRETALVAGELRTCRSWPSSTRTAATFGALPDVPTLILAGAADLRTPLEDAETLARSLPRAQLVPVRGGGHAVLFGGYACVERAVARFLTGRRVGRCPKGTVVPATGLLPALGPKLPPVTAALLTLEDVLAQVPLAINTKATFGAGDFLFFLRAGGLRGGRYSATLTMLTLERVIVVPGVAVSGRIRGLVDPFQGAIRVPSGHLTVRVQGKSTGTLYLDQGRLTGTMDGRAVSRRLVLDGRSLVP